MHVVAAPHREQAPSTFLTEFGFQCQVGYKAPLALLWLLIWGTPSLGEVPSGGAKTFWLLLGRLPKVTRCRAEP
jgi:hypothetical protein